MPSDGIGLVSSVYTWASTRVGVRVPVSELDSSYTWGSDITGYHPPYKGQVAGTYSWAKTLASKRVPVSELDGTYTWVSDCHGYNVSPSGYKYSNYGWVGFCVGHSKHALGTVSSTYTWASTVAGEHASGRAGTGNYNFQSTNKTGKRYPEGTVYRWYTWKTTAVGYKPRVYVPPPPPPPPEPPMPPHTAPLYDTSFYQRCRVIIEDTQGNIVARDVIVQEAKVVRQLSGPCAISFKIHHREPSIQNNVALGPILLKPWGHWVHVEKELWDGTRKIIASGIVQPSEVDPQSGILALEAKGFSDYPKGLPWLVNWNPFVVDPFVIFSEIWEHIQGFENGDLGVTTFPAESGALMLPGWSFDSENFIQDFFAIFIREVDRIDCGEYLEALARDIPIDYWERSEWNSMYSSINKSIELAYPHGGVDQTGLAFRINENVISAKQKVETEMNWVSGVTVKGWFPTKEYYSEFTNADPNRYRRVIDEADARIDSDERAKVWAHRQLTKRQIPKYYESITIDPFHPNAPFGTWDVGDTITVSGLMPWHGDVTQKHRIIAYGWELDTNNIELRLMAEGAFLYDPIEYIPS